MTDTATKEVPARSFDETLLLLIEPFAKCTADKNQALVAADYADELDLPNCAWLLRHLGSVEFDRPFFFTGSRCYGQPKPTSDFDFVLLISPFSRFPYEATCDVVCGTSDAGTPEDYSSIVGRIAAMDKALRFGPINLICVSAAQQYFAWQNARDRLLSEKLDRGQGVTRTRAVKVHKREFLDKIDGYDPRREDY